MIAFDRLGRSALLILVVAILALLVIFQMLPDLGYFTKGTVTLQTSGLSVPVATNRVACTLWTYSRKTKNKWQQYELLADGYVFPVESGTKAKIIKRDALMCGVLILDGIYAGKDGWVALEDVR